MIQAKALICPSCGANLQKKQEICNYCGNYIVYEETNDNYAKTTSFSSNNLEKLLKNQTYQSVKDECEKLLQMNPGNPQINYYLCIALLDGKKPFLLSRDVIDKCIKITDRMLESSQKPEYYLLRAYIEYDYFERKFLNRSRGYDYYYGKSKELGLTDDIQHQLEKLLQQKIILNTEDNGDEYEWMSNLN